ncbi:hypothetical protein OROHE_005013 [Orobanche hederae]
MSGPEEVKEQPEVGMPDIDKSPPTKQQEVEEAVKKKYGGILPRKPPLISKDHERAYFDSADWALGKVLCLVVLAPPFAFLKPFMLVYIFIDVLRRQQGTEKPKGPLEALRPKLQPTQQQTRYHKSPCAPSVEDRTTPPIDCTPANEREAE